MKAAQARHVLNQAGALAGLRVDQGIDTQEFAKLRAFMSDWLQRVVVSAKWAGTTKYEARYFAEDWDGAVAYTAGDVVVHDEVYYEAIDATTGDEPPDASFWSTTITATVVREVAYQQAGRSEIGIVYDVTDLDPRLDSRVRRYDFLKVATGVRVKNSPLGRVWITFAATPPVLHGDVLDLTASYAVGDQVYFDGDFWDCVATAAAGDTPDTDPAMWSKITIYTEWLPPLVAGVYYEWLLHDGQADKAARQLVVAESKLNDAVALEWVAQGQNMRR